MEKNKKNENLEQDYLLATKAHLQRAISCLAKIVVDVCDPSMTVYKLERAKAILRSLMIQRELFCRSSDGTLYLDPQ